MDSRTLALGFLCLAACSRDEFLRLPATEGFASAIVAVKEPSEDLTLTAYSMDGLHGPIVVSSEARVWLLLYPLPLADLQLSPGSLRTAVTGEPIPPPEEIHAASLEDPKWIRETTEPFWVKNTQLQAPSPCVAFEAQSRVVTATDAEDFQTATLLRVDDSTALAVASRLSPVESRLYLVRSDGSAELVLTSTIALTAGVRVDAQIFLLSARGGLYEWSLDQGTVFVPPIRLAARSIRVESVVRGGRFEGEIEIFVAGYGLLQRLHGSEWTLLSEGGHRKATGIAYSGPGKVMALVNPWGALLDYDAARAQPLGAVAFEEDEEELRALEYLDRMGVVLMTERGRAFQRASSGWMHLNGGSEAELGANSAELLVFYREGFLAFGGHGFVGQFDRSHGFCPAELLAADRIVAAVQLGEIVVGVVSDPDDGIPPTVVTLNPLHP